jgi:uracil-DNA glycosylase
VTPLQAYASRWANGCGASICATAHKVVHVRGTVPCDVLLVGEAPGPSENVLGQPFVGPAGHLIDEIVGRAFKRVSVCSTCGVAQVLDNGLVLCPQCRGFLARPITRAFCNLVGCIPLNQEGAKFEEPDAESIECCAPRLQELVNLCAPRLVVCVGKLAGDWLKPGYKNPVTLPTGCRVVNVIHPAAILRASVAQKGFLAQRAEVTITTAVQDL